MLEKSNITTPEARLPSLIEFAKQFTRLKTKTAATVAEHAVFMMFEHQLQGLPGVMLNSEGEDDGAEVWLTINRLRPTEPPVPANSILTPWIDLPNHSSKVEEPRLRDAVAASSLPMRIELAGEILARRDPERLIALIGYDYASEVQASFTLYVNNEWTPWANDERLRRSAIDLYAKLFTLKQQLDGGMVDAQIELVWGVGIGVWRFNETTVTYPILTKLVELSLDAETAALEIRPRQLEARVESDWYAAADNPGVAELERRGKEFFSSATGTFSPFQSDTFEPLLRVAAATLDANGSYWRDQILPEDRSVPKADNRLKVTDTWVLFARPRTSNVLIQDLDHLKTAAETAIEFPPAITAIVSDPSTENPIVELPAFRGVSISSPSGTQAKDLFFPKPFNEEQVRIIQLLEVSDGVVVQGPPGTGKTHTIANVICHYLASGKRVLVTSMKDPALAVLREQLPDEIRPLAIALLSSEQEGMKQFEHAIQTIATEVQRLDRSATAREIALCEQSIDTLHSRIAQTDHNIDEWARRSLSTLHVDDEEIEPRDAARELIASNGGYLLIPDHVPIGPEGATPLSIADIVRLRDARRVLGPDLAYLDSFLPQAVEFPDPQSLLQVHQDLGTFEKLKRQIELGAVPPLADSSASTLLAAQELLTSVQALRKQREDVEAAAKPWTAEIKNRLRIEPNGDLFLILDDLGAQLMQAADTRKAFLLRPVATPDGLDRDPAAMTALANLAEGRPAFSFFGGIGKADSKRLLEQVTVTGSKPALAEEWQHVRAYLALQDRLHKLAVRWNALAVELPFGARPGTKPEDGLAAASEFSAYIQLRDSVQAETLLVRNTAAVFPTWSRSSEVARSDDALRELERALNHHLTKSRLAHVWAHKERCQRVLDNRTGPVCDSLRAFLADTLGSPEISDSQMQSQWSALIAELARVHALASHLLVVRDSTGAIERAGAPQHAEALRRPLTTAVDPLLPDNWRNVWRLRRIATYLDSVDGQEVLQRLSKQRNTFSTDLARAYSDVVVKRTWLKLAEQAAPNIRAALQAYLTAIRRIGKGTGKSAPQYRRDAQMAVAQANPAVPCWIMAHYRVSESLPPELGCFDLVIIDEASQSDFTALPALLRAKKVLIVGDDKQVSPESIGLQQQKVYGLMNRFLGGQVDIYRAQMSPDRSMYDLFRVVFARSAVMLKEHFRCVGPIIEYSKREFYNHELKPLRLPKASERLDPPLIDVYVEDGYRSGDVNHSEARFIVDEIKSIVADPKMAERTIGVVSLLADKQAASIWNMLVSELDMETITRHRIACGDARTFQGKERDIMFLSMVSAPNEIGASLSRDTFAQRFNVAASRARDRMYLVRSLEIDDLSAADTLRRSLIMHFASPFAQDETRVEDARKLCESDFERDLYDELTKRGYRIVPQVKVGHFRIDMVVEGANDARLAIECDGDQYHGADRWAADMERQRVLERAGWTFWRCFASDYIRRRTEVLNDLIHTLTEMSIEPIGSQNTPTSVHVEHRTFSMTEKEDVAEEMEEAA